ncbi:MAG: cupin domain-containing protein [Proteobacteria bacterium]|nr:cupin domain-containing protein [Pseudomonadota bacterium]
MDRCAHRGKGEGGKRQEYQRHRGQSRPYPALAEIGDAEQDCRHDSADELFVVRSGKLTIHYQDRDVTLGPDEFHVVPRGAVHKTSSKEGAEVLFVGPDDWIRV